MSVTARNTRASIARAMGINATQARAVAPITAPTREIATRREDLCAHREESACVAAAQPIAQRSPGQTTFDKKLSTNQSVGIRTRNTGRLASANLRGDRAYFESHFVSSARRCGSIRTFFTKSLSCSLARFGSRSKMSGWSSAVDGTGFRVSTSPRLTGHVGTGEVVNDAP